jgi:hypothetical protein
VRHWHTYTHAFYFGGNISVKKYIYLNFSTGRARRARARAAAAQAGYTNTFMKQLY